MLKQKPENFADLYNLASVDVEDAVNAARKLISKLYDPKAKSKQAHGDLNRLRVKLATRKDSSLARLPPCEATFLQHVLRASFQTKVWMNANEPNLMVGTPLEYGWKEGKYGLEPVLFEGQMTSDFLQDLVCTCKGKSVCSRGCVCFEQNLSCTELCPCQASDLCHNDHTHTRDVEEDEDIF